MDLFLAARRGFVVVRVSLKLGFRPLVCKLLRLAPPRISAAERLRMGAEELGITYLKLGQFLATRYDILPEEVCRQLSSLFDRVSAMPFSVVRALVETELMLPLEEAFLKFTKAPLAAGSLAQVHEAVSNSGQRLAVKVQRPDVRKILEADASILRLLAALVDRTSVLGAMTLTPVVNDFFAWTNKELDFILEGKTTDRLRANTVEGEFLPKIYWSLTTARLLTMELLEGISLAQVRIILDRGGEGLLQEHLPGIQLQSALHNLTTIYLRQLFVTGFFHGDPHPGNILLRKDNSIAFVDCGIAGSLLPSQRLILLGYYSNLAIGDIAKSVSYYMKLTEAEGAGDTRKFAQQLEGILRRWFDASRDPLAGLQELHWGSYVNEIVAAARKNDLKLRSDYLMWARAIGMLNTDLLMFSVDFLSELRVFFNANQMLLIQPLLDSFSEQNWQQELVSLWADGPRKLSDVLDHKRDRRVWNLSTLQPPLTKRSMGSRHRSLAFSLIGVSVSSVAAAGIGVDRIFTISFAALAMLYLVWMLTESGGA